MFTVAETNPGPAQLLLIDARVVGAMLGQCERSVWRDDAAGRNPARSSLEVPNAGGSKNFKSGQELAVRPEKSGNHGRIDQSYCLSGDEVWK